MTTRVFCWHCGGKLEVSFAHLLVDGDCVNVHHRCLPEAERAEAARRVTRQPCDEVPYLLRHYPEVRYG